MADSTNLPAPDPQAPPILSSAPPKSIMHKIFTGPNGIRAGWRMSIFMTIVVASGAGANFSLRAYLHATGRKIPSGGPTTPLLGLLNEGSIFLIVLLAAWIMSKIERRTVADYALPARRAFCAQFWQGALIGFAAISTLLAAMHLAGVFSFGTLALHGAEAWKYAGLWALAFLCVSLFEEFFVRGYMLFTLTTGTGFWPAAVLLSVLFGLAHTSNPGESHLGAFTAGAIGFVFCLVLRRTGDLWMPIGLHLGWDWGETYFYGVPDSGLAAQGHLLNSSSHGPTWLTGGTVGPEGSWLCVVVIVILWILFATWLRVVKYPNLAAIPDPRRR